MNAKELAKYYTYIIEWSPEDGVFLATVAEWESLGAHGSSPTNALLEMIVLVTASIEDCEEEGDDYPLPYNLPLREHMN